MQTINYTPPPTVGAFIQDFQPGALFYSWIVGPLGSGKTTGNFMKLVYMAKLQKRGPDGVRRSRCVVVRNTRPELKDTTIKSWFSWFKDGEAGRWKATDMDFILKFGDVECEVLFRPLDTPDDVARVLSLEVTFAIIDEFIEIPKPIVDALSGRLGRYPAKKDGGATNWGMWGASNPGTEDKWWYDYLHNKNEYADDRGANVQIIELFGGMKINSSILLRSEPPGNVRYFHQPPGDSVDAENVENLPDNYYINQMKGKSPAWVEQFVRANWGFSVSETPVVKTFQPTIHISRSRLQHSRFMRLVIGLDPGIGGISAVFGQEDLYGRLLVLGELGPFQGMGAERFCRDKIKPYLRQHFPDADFMFAPDPASANKQPTDERTVVDAIKRVFGPVVSIETNNRLSKRLEAIEDYSTRITEIGPALLIDQVMCPMLVRALGGGWRYQKMNRHDSNRPEPEKNNYSHIGDAFGYLCRYFRKQFERTNQRGQTLAEQQRRRIVQGSPRYHFK